jgi:hypothetical protein
LFLNLHGKNPRIKHMTAAGKVTSPGEPERHVLPPSAGLGNRHTASTEALASNDFG